MISKTSPLANNWQQAMIVIIEREGECMTGKHSVTDIWTPPGEEFKEFPMTESLLIYALCADDKNGNNHYHYAIHNVFAPLGFEVLCYNDTMSFVKDFDYTAPSLVIIHAHPDGWKRFLSKSTVKFIDGVLELALLAGNRNCPPVVVFSNHDNKEQLEKLQSAIWGSEGESTALSELDSSGKINPNSQTIKKTMAQVSDYYKEAAKYPNATYLPTPFEIEDLKNAAFDLMPYAYFAAQKTEMDMQVELASDKLDDELYKIWLDRVKGLTAVQSAVNFDGYEVYDIENRRKKINTILKAFYISQHIDKTGMSAEMMMRREYTETTPEPPKRHKPKPTPPKKKQRVRGPNKKK